MIKIRTDGNYFLLIENGLEYEGHSKNILIKRVTTTGSDFTIQGLGDWWSSRVINIEEIVDENDVPYTLENFLVFKNLNTGKHSSGDGAETISATQGEVDAGVNNEKSVTPFTFSNAEKWGTKVDMVEGKGLSEADYTTDEKTKLSGIASGAQVNVATNLSTTNGTTGGPTINSSTGSNVTLPIASGSASGVITTGNQTIAGIKTFTSPPSFSQTTETPIQTGDKFLFTDANNSSAVRRSPVGFDTNQGGSFLRRSGSFSPLNATEVCVAIAGTSVGAIGTYAFLGSAGGSSASQGQTKAGSQLRYAGILTTNTGGFNNQYPAASFFVGNINTPLTGTWRCMGRDLTVGDAQWGASLYLRIL